MPVASRIRSAPPVTGTVAATTARLQVSQPPPGPAVPHLRPHCSEALRGLRHAASTAQLHGSATSRPGHRCGQTTTLQSTPTPLSWILGDSLASVPGPIFDSRNASLAIVDWLKAGFLYGRRLRDHPPISARGHPDGERGVELHRLCGGNHQGAADHRCHSRHDLVRGNHGQPDQCRLALQALF